MGQKIEQQARAFLENQKLIWVESNFFAKVGEIDLVMLDPQDDGTEKSSYELVFVEVRFRSPRSRLLKSEGAESGLVNVEALESVSFKKRRRIEKAIQWYLLKRGTWIKKIQPQSIRFDVLGFNGTDWSWIRNQSLTD